MHDLSSKERTGDVESSSAQRIPPMPPCEWIPEERPPRPPAERGSSSDPSANRPERTRQQQEPGARRTRGRAGLLSSVRPAGPRWATGPAMSARAARASGARRTPATREDGITAPGGHHADDRLHEHGHTADERRRPGRAPRPVHPQQRADRPHRPAAAPRRQVHAGARGPARRRGVGVRDHRGRCAPHRRAAAARRGDPRTPVPRLVDGLPHGRRRDPPPAPRLRRLPRPPASAAARPDAPSRARWLLEWFRTHPA
ncbi:hypothetical protein BC477_08040 [Clavibacter michiganensis subsp. michiganensis]|uniref:Uncharacterized protein n=1 Tax=Clavibacter michiganensis subsp. michiganensis TaxID=33013 RepID=A0A251XMK5_CLAMM|nr:hypothetical protein BC477_08040 [Clavibacter michiganensis subsp. michiganensis]OUE04671.1 hypothetical protein CMMCAS07_06970 [Clavibacter michiganensis subsp. michiganensis]